MNKQIVQIGAERTSNFNLVIKGAILAYIVTFVMFAIFAIVLSFTDFPDKFIHGVVIITTAVSLMVGGTAVGRSAKNMGWMNGALMGFVYVAVLYFIGGIINKNFAIDGNVFVIVCIGLVSSALGGMIGINLRGRQRGSI